MKKILYEMVAIYVIISAFLFFICVIISNDPPCKDYTKEITYKKLLAPTVILGCYMGQILDKEI
jgi:hypothetical protein